MATLLPGCVPNDLLDSLRDLHVGTTQACSGTEAIPEGDGLGMVGIQLGEWLIIHFRSLETLIGDMPALISRAQRHPHLLSQRPLGPPVARPACSRCAKWPKELTLSE